jgi:broad specificity phosphatase PhoE
MRLTLIRHGQTAWNVAGRAQGHTDIGLDPTGLEQVATLGDVFTGRRIDLLLSSDLLRCRETVAPIETAAGVSATFTERLRERKFGEWEGSSYGTVAAPMSRRPSISSLGGRMMSGMFVIVTSDVLATSW